MWTILWRVVNYLALVSNRGVGKLLFSRVESVKEYLVWSCSSAWLERPPIARQVSSSNLL